ncbi:hypothetical protein M431DRAFT_509660 [Trichoderma harzianum CBS 226.95]|uniref:Uncharacterized protein n=1 Tax=Trichoderma harzianum CBS 226.95 TaxID=983964 RepID=A0A2T4A8R7_TRIHA|nr:hypothetical protein M431DRAFT_509660 [Trichoderma harzianum CBS 226.95]PTB53383.1 hypothetical protein M431DRAFT_509660 [Trichoderma harzianum CBS 226.95]
MCLHVLCEIKMPFSKMHAVLAKHLHLRGRLHLHLNSFLTRQSSRFQTANDQRCGDLFLSFPRSGYSCLFVLVLPLSLNATNLLCLGFSVKGLDGSRATLSLVGYARIIAAIPRTRAAIDTTRSGLELVIQFALGCAK